MAELNDDGTVAVGGASAGAVAGGAARDLRRGPELGVGGPGAGGRAPEWGAVLVDLRQHGESTGFDGPHTVEADGGGPGRVRCRGDVRAVLGHSFGGKIALLRGRDDETVEQVWVVDSTPEVREPEGARGGCSRCSADARGPFEDRDEAVSALEAEGVSAPGRPLDDHQPGAGRGRLHWRLDLDDMEALLRDFFRTDLWELVESPREGLELHFIRATESPVLGAGGPWRTGSGRRDGVRAGSSSTTCRAATG
jgi:esterase